MVYYKEYNVDREQICPPGRFDFTRRRTRYERKKAEKFPTYKGKPLVRCGDTIYYGSMKDKYVIKMDIKSKKKVKDLEVADRVAVHLMYTDAAVRNRKQIVRSSEQKGLYLALDIASAWLSRALAEDNDH